MSNGKPDDEVITIPAGEMTVFTPASPGTRVDLVAPDTPSQNRRKKAMEEESQKVVERIQSHKDSLLSNPDEDRCLICMNGFTKRQPPYRIPCSQKCNETSVHEKCVYEWKERQAGNGSCPLCRSPLTEMTYVPPDALRSATFHIFAVRKDFVTRPIDPKVGMVRCYLRVTRIGLTGVSVGYEIFLQAPSILQYPLGPLPRSQGPAPGDQLLLVARKKFVGLTKGHIEMTLDRKGKDYEKDGHNYLGSVISNFSGLDHVGVVPSEESPNKHAEIMCVQYSQNRIGRGVGPRKMRVAFPKTTIDTNAKSVMEGEDEEEEDFDEDFERQSHPKYKAGMIHPTNKHETLSHMLRENTEQVNKAAHPSQHDDDAASPYTPPENVLFGKNKEPYWLESIMAYSLDFHGRVTLPSNKNFILMLPAGNRPPNTNPIQGDTSDAQVCLQFGKVEEILNECYTLDVAYPLSVLQAAVVALSDWGDDKTIVGSQLSKFIEDEKPPLGLLLGDNFYEAGVKSTDDPQWKTKYLDVFKNLPKTRFMVTLGNHDYYGNATAQVEYTKKDPTKRWLLPSFYHTRYFEEDGVKLFIISIDTWRLNGGDALLGHDPRSGRTWVRSKVAISKAIENGEISQEFGDRLYSRYEYEPERISYPDDEQLKWIERVLQSETAMEADWKLVIGHYPIHSCSLLEHGDTKSLIKMLDPMLRKYKVDAYFAGHDHILQAIHKRGDIHYYGSGAGAKRHKLANPFYPGLLRSVHGYFGFMRHVATKDTLTTTFITSIGDDLGNEKSEAFTYVQEKKNKDEIVVAMS